MVITATEASLAALLIAFVSGVIIPIWRGRKYVTCEDCEKQHAADKDGQQILYRMVRALILHSDMSTDEKEKVLNDRGIDS